MPMTPQISDKTRGTVSVVALCHALLRTACHCDDHAVEVHPDSPMARTCLRSGIIIDASLGDIYVELPARAIATMCEAMSTEQGEVDTSFFKANEDEPEVYILELEMRGRIPVHTGTFSLDTWLEIWQEAIKRQTGMEIPLTRDAIIKVTRQLAA